MAERCHLCIHVCKLSDNDVTCLEQDVLFAIPLAGKVDVAFMLMHDHQCRAHHGRLADVTLGQT